MSLRLKVISGPLQGKTFVIATGAVIGRSVVDVQINDPKISGRHAKFELSSSGQFTLVDLGSKSGIRHNDQKLNKLALTHGVVFTLGRTNFEVLADLSDAETAPPIEKPSVPLDVPVPWSEYFAHFAMRAKEKVVNEPIELRPFAPLVKLHVLTGIQSGTQWVLGYGPREFGLGSLDHPLFEEGLPAIAFKIEPQGANALFSTEHPDKIKLNGRMISTETLMSGDEITLGLTKIKVSFAE